MNERRLSLSPRGVVHRAPAAIFVPRAHAAQKCDDRLGLAIRFRRSERERLPPIYQWSLISGPAAISVAWHNDQMADLDQPAAPALRREHSTAKSPIYAMLDLALMSTIPQKIDWISISQTIVRVYEAA